MEILNNKNIYNVECQFFSIVSHLYPYAPNYCAIVGMAEFSLFHDFVIIMFWNNNALLSTRNFIFLRDIRIVSKQHLFTETRICYSLRGLQLEIRNNLEPANVFKYSSVTRHVTCSTCRDRLVSTYLVIFYSSIQYCASV